MTHVFGGEEEGYHPSPQLNGQSKDGSQGSTEEGSQAQTGGTIWGKQVLAEFALVSSRKSQAVAGIWAIPV